MPNQVDAVLLDTRSGTELSRVRTELHRRRRLAAVSPHPVQAHSQPSAHCYLGDTLALTHRQVNVPTSPVRVVTRTSSFLNSFPPAGGGQEYLINPQPSYQTDWNGWGPACARGLECVAGSACAHGRGGHSDSAEYLAGQSSDRVYTLRCLSTCQCGTKRGDFPDSKSHRTNCRRSITPLAPIHQLSLLSLSGIDRRFGNG